jgi:cell division septum initiation protein DivIVA
LSANETNFAVVLRGYDRAAVDDAILDLRKELLQLSALNTQLASELRDANKKIEELQAELAEVGEPSYAGVGARAALILSTAQDQATRVISEAETQRAQILNNTNLESDDLKHEAKGFYDALVAEAQKRADRLISAGRAEAEQIVSEARSEALRLRDEATREAGTIRSAIATEVAKQRANAKRQTEKLKTSVERDLAERKLLALRDNTAELDMKRAAELISEQARIDLELELTARRDEAEAEYLEKHQEAVATTQKYLDDANAQLALALNLTNTARLEAETLEAAAKSLHKSSRDSAKAQAEAIVAAAEAEARVLTSQARLEASRTQRDALAQLANYQVEREAVTVYIDNLATLVETARQKLASQLPSTNE